MEIAIPAAPLRRALTIAVIALTLVSFAGTLGVIFLDWRLGGLVRIVHVNAEMSVPTWYSSVAIFVSALLLAAVAATLRARRESRDLLAWTALAFIFTLLSLDEIAGIHEGVDKAISSVRHMGGFFHFAWVIPALVLLPLGGALFLPFLSRLTPRRRRQFIIAGLVFTGGAVGMEMVGGKLSSAEGEKLTVAYAVCFHIEEFLEMLGIVLFNAALIEHLAELLGPTGLRLRFSDD